MTQTWMLFRHYSSSGNISIIKLEDIEHLVFLHGLQDAWSVYLQDKKLIDLIDGTKGMLDQQLTDFLDQHDIECEITA